MAFKNMMLLLLSATSVMAFSPSAPLKTSASFQSRMHRMNSLQMGLDGYDMLVKKFGEGPSPLARRDILRFAATAPLLATSFAWAQEPKAYELAPLPFAYDALEPHIDAATMKFHHDFHHATYVTKLNAAMAGKSAPSLLDLQAGALKTGGVVRNCGGGHYNHALFWTTLGPASASGAPSGELAAAIDKAFGSLDDFKAKFATDAANVFGSGWAWLVVNKDGSVAIATTPNQDNPLMDGALAEKAIPILGLDVWEHAYYLKYQNRRPEYITAFWNVVNWAKVSEYYATAKGGSAVAV